MLIQNAAFIKWGSYVTQLMFSKAKWLKILQTNKINMTFIIRLGSSKQHSNVKRCVFYGFGFLL